MAWRMGLIRMGLMRIGKTHSFCHACVLAMHAFWPISSSFGIKRQIWNRKGDTRRLHGAAVNLVSTRSYGNAAQKLPVNPL